MHENREIRVIRAWKVYPARKPCSGATLSAIRQALYLL